jgi:hypothetical protein
MRLTLADSTTPDHARHVRGIETRCGMTSNLGSLGTPRIGIALIWFLDGGAGQRGEPAGPTHSPGPPGPPVTPPAAAEDIEFVRGLTGLAPDELVTRLQDIAAGYARDPGALRAEILSITGGDEIAAGYLMQVIQAAGPSGGEASADGARQAEGRVIELPLHVPGSGDDDSGDP